MKIKYTGDLAKTIPEPIYGLLLSDEEIKRIDENLKREKYRRMVLLFDAHKIAHGNWEELCFSLARESVPCFKQKNKEGRPLKWDDYTLAVLYVEIERLTRKEFAAKPKTIRAATKELSIRIPWKLIIEKWSEGSFFGGDPSEAINSAYKESKKNHLSKIALDAFKLNILQGTISEWDA